MSRGPIDDLSGFAASLRHRGLIITPDQVGDMARAMTIVDVSSRQQTHDALIGLAITDPEQRATFDEEFLRFFGARLAGHEEAPEAATLRPVVRKPLVEQAGEGFGDAEDTEGASDAELVSRRDFADLDEAGLIAARHLVMSMMWQPSDVRTRRWLHSNLGGAPDMRRTLRGTVRPDGDLIPIATRRRRMRQRPLVIIADISGSMEKYAELFLVFAHAAQRRMEQVEVFTFSTELTRITDDLKRRDTREALARVTESVTDWSGGTRIGAAIAEWNRQWSRRLSRGGPIALVLSDGWDCGDPDLLSSEMALLSRSVHRVIWLNPLAARPDYEPATRGMQAALPHIDRLLPAASVDDFRGVVRVLDSLSTVGK